MKRVYLPFCEVADTPFHIQGDDIYCCDVRVDILFSFHRHNPHQIQTVVYWLSQTPTHLGNWKMMRAEGYNISFCNWLIKFSDFHQISGILLKFPGFSLSGKSETHFIGFP